jgi:hypothetical protein
MQCTSDETALNLNIAEVLTLKIQKSIIRCKRVYNLVTQTHRELEDMTKVKIMVIFCPTLLCSLSKP